MKITETEDYYRLDIKDAISPAIEATSILAFLEEIGLPEFITDKAVDGEYFSDRTILVSPKLQEKITIDIAKAIIGKNLGLAGNKVTEELTYNFYMLGIESCRLMPSTIPDTSKLEDSEDNLEHCIYAIKNVEKILGEDWDPSDRDETVQYLTLLVKLKAKRNNYLGIRKFKF